MKRQPTKLEEKMCKWCILQGINLQNIKTIYTAQYQTQSPQRKWAEHLNRHTDCKKAHKKMLNVATYYRNTNQNEKRKKSCNEVYHLTQIRMKVKVKSHSVLSLCNLTDYTVCEIGLDSPWNSPGQNTGVGSLSLLQGIFPTQASCIAGRFLTSWATREAPKYWSG